MEATLFHRRLRRLKEEKREQDKILFLNMPYVIIYDRIKSEVIQNICAFLLLGYINQDSAKFKQTCQSLNEKKMFLSLLYDLLLILVTLLEITFKICFHDNYGKRDLWS